MYKLIVIVLLFVILQNKKTSQLISLMWVILQNILQNHMRYNTAYFQI